MGGSSVSRLGGTMAQSCEACKHGAQPIKQREQVGRLVVRRQSEDLHSLDRGRGFRCFAPRAAKAGESVAAGTAGRFCDTEEARQQRASELVGQGCVTTGNSSCDSVATGERIACDGEGVQAVVIEFRHAEVSTNRPLCFDRVLTGTSSANRPRSRRPPSNTNTDTDSLTVWHPPARDVTNHEPPPAPPESK